MRGYRAATTSFALANGTFYLACAERDRVHDSVARTVRPYPCQARGGTVLFSMIFSWGSEARTLSTTVLLTYVK